MIGSRIKEYIKKYEYIDIIVLVATVIIFSLLFSNHFGLILPDRGRELLIPQEILNGAVPFKDITLIYFPFAYYINAFIYKIFGVSINSFIMTQTAVCSVFVIGYYYLAKEFLNRKLSFILSLLIISCCIFSANELFNYILPYSFSRIYGVLSFFWCVFAIIKFSKTNSIKYVYLAAILAGFSFCCKLEFLSSVVFFVISLFLCPRLKFSQYIKTLAMFMIFPLINIFILYQQGITFKEIYEAIIYGIKFAKTPVMTRFLTEGGMYPAIFFRNIHNIYLKFQYILMLLLLSFLSLKLLKKSRNYIYFACTFIFIVYCSYEFLAAERFWIWLPVGLLVLFLIHFKRIKKAIPLLLLVIASLFLAQREFFSLSLLMYGTYAFPLLILSFCTIIDRTVQQEIYSIKLRDIVSLFFTILICFYTYGLWLARLENDTKIITPKGNFYISYEISMLLRNTSHYLKNYTNSDSTVLVLPEGNIINYITDRKVDMHCFMMDRLYYDAYGKQEATDRIRKTNSDYIVIIKMNNMNIFSEPFLYDTKSPSFKKSYIAKNYKEVTKFKNLKGEVIIFENKKLKKIPSKTFLK